MNIDSFFVNSQVKVVDRTAVETTNAETEVVKPPGLQEAINVETGNDNSEIYICLANKLHVSYFSVRSVSYTSFQLN